MELPRDGGRFLRAVREWFVGTDQKLYAVLACEHILALERFSANERGEAIVPKHRACSACRAAATRSAA